MSLDAFLPFYRHLVPADTVRAAVRPSAAPVVHPDRLDEVLDSVRDGLTRAVEGQAFRMLIGAFHAFRDRLGLPATRENDAALRRFSRTLEDPAECRRILDAHPVFARRVATLLRDSLAAHAEVFRGYAEDLPALRAAGLLPPGEDERLTSVSLAGSDLHNGGRQVVGVRLVGGTRLVFKPRPLTPDALVRDLYAAADPYLRHSLRACIPASVSRGDHGWQQFVLAGPMAGAEEVPRYFYRFGALCAVFGAIGACDLHHENLLARGEHPCVVDTETVLRPDPFGAGDTLPTTLVERLQLSVATTMLLPMTHPGSHIDVLMAGVGIAEQQSSTMRRPVVRDPGTDALAVGWETVTYRHEGNVPRLGEAPLRVTDHYADVRAGYLDALAFVRGGDLTRVLDAHPELPVRCLIRSTSVYSQYIDAATHPDYLTRHEEADRLLRLLDHFPDHVTSDAAAFIGRAERASLATANVPYFTTRAGSREIATTRGGFADVYRRAPLEFARAGVAVAATRSDRAHLFLLEESLGELLGEDRPEGLSAHSVFGGDELRDATAGTWWRAVAAALADLGTTVDGPAGPQTGWICGVGPGDTPTLAPGNFVAFHDAGGVVTFLERAARHDPALRPAALGARRGLGTLLAEYHEGLAQAPESVFSGTASRLLSAPSLVTADWLTGLLDTVDARAAAGEAGRDLAMGPAGPLMVLLARAESGAPGARCDEARLARLRDLVVAGLGRAPAAEWWDVAHGELGLRWACARAGRVLGDPRLARDAADWLQARWAEEDHGTGRPSRAGWCKGAAGLLLASAEILTAAARPERLTGQRLRTLLDQATRLPAEGPVDLSVCHGSSGVVQSLLATARLLDDASLLDVARGYQERVLDVARTRGFSTGVAGRTSLLGYQLGWAGVGDTDVLLHASGSCPPTAVPAALAG